MSNIISHFLCHVGLLITRAKGRAALVDHLVVRDLLFDVRCTDLWPNSNYAGYYQPIVFEQPFPSAVTLFTTR